MTFPLTVAVTVSDTVIVVPTTVVPVLSVAVIVMVPVYVPGSNVAALILTPKVLPLPLSVPDGASSTSQGVLPVEAVQVTGRAHVPVSLNVTFCTLDRAVPCGTVKERLPGEGGESTQGGWTVSVTVNDWGLPCTVAPLASLAEMVTWVVYVPAFRPLMVAPTPILPD